VPLWPGEALSHVQTESLFEALHKQVTGFAAMSFIIIETMRRRFVESRSSG